MLSKLKRVARRLGVYTAQDMRAARESVGQCYEGLLQEQRARIEELEQLLERQRRKPAPPVAYFTSEAERLREVDR